MIEKSMIVQDERITMYRYRVIWKYNGMNFGI